MEQSEYARFVRLEARVHQMEEAMQALCIRLGLDPAEVLPKELLQGQQLNPAIRDALLRGNKIEAIKLYREQYSVGLKEAKDAIDAMEYQVRGY
jgi:ribosomal protein L7/L12